jgi:hypothetical protein
MLPDKINVRCDSCGEEYSYKRTEILRGEVQVPELFVPHHCSSTQLELLAGASLHLL